MSSNQDQQLEDDALFAASLAAEDEPSTCDSDATLATMLQRQFDREYNDHITRQESRINGQSKVGVSLDKYRRQSDYADADSDDELQDYSENEADHQSKFYRDTRVTSKSTNQRTGDNRVWDRFEQSELDRRGHPLGRAGFVRESDGTITTKHDIPLTNRRNMCRLMELKSDIETGDAGNKQHDFGLNNYVYNRLKVHSKKNQRRNAQRDFDKRERETTAVLEDIQSFKMTSATKIIVDGLLVNFKIDKLNGVIGQGKEAVILHATGLNHENIAGQEVAIKVFRTKLPELSTRENYVKTKCPSYKFDKMRSKNDAINKWAERGYKNLKMMRRANINCPDAISLKKHVLVMSFIGNNARPSPQLREADLTVEQLGEAYKQVKTIMHTMYNECELIHADMSEYNLLWHEDQVYVIDVSQSIDITHPNANRYLYRDCDTITQFFTRNGLEVALESELLFKEICGKDLTDKDIELWTKIEDFPRNAKQSMHNYLIGAPSGADPFEEIISQAPASSPSA